MLSSEIAGILFWLTVISIFVVLPLSIFWRLLQAVRKVISETDRLSLNLVNLNKLLQQKFADQAKAAPETAAAESTVTTEAAAIDKADSASAQDPGAPIAATPPEPIPPPLPMFTPLPREAPETTAKTEPPPLPPLEEQPEPAMAEAAVAATPAAATPEEAPPPPPLKPWQIAARQRLLACWNWFICGHVDGPGDQSLEKLAATTWLLRAGILICLFTVGFLLKITISRGLLGPTGRVTLTFLTGAGLLLWSLKLLNSQYRVMGQAILGLSLATFYFAVYAASGMHHLLPASLGFLCMAAITAAAGYMAIKFETIAVAIIATIGGYATPMLLHTGSKNFPVLFTYMFILGVGVLAVATYRDWLPLNWLGMIFTYALFFISWQAQYEVADFPVMIIAVSCFFIQYSTVVFIHNVAQNKPSTTLEVSALLVNAALFTGFAYRLIATITNDKIWFAPLTLSLAAFYILHTFWFLRRRHHDRGLMLTFLGLSALFLTLTIPLVFAAEWQGVSWALLALLMLWLGQNLDSAFLRSGAWLLYALVIGRMVGRDFFAAYPRHAPEVSMAIFWRGFAERLVQFSVPLASLAYAARLHMRPTAPGKYAVSPESDYKPRSLPLPIPPALLAVLIAAGLFFLYCNLEAVRTLDVLFPPLQRPFLTILWLGGAAIVLHLHTQFAHRGWKVLLQVLILATVIKLLLFDFFTWHPHLDLCFYILFSWTEVAMRLVDFGPTIAFLIVVATITQRQEKRLATLASRLWPSLLFLYTTMELNTLLQHLMPQLRAGGISVLWATFAAAFIYRGLVGEQRWLRYLGLVMFAGIVVKVFLYDLARLGNIHRVFAFLLFGLLLMAGAFLYLKFWQGDRHSPTEQKKD